MKKFARILLSVLLAFSVLASFTACNTSKPVTVKSFERIAAEGTVATYRATLSDGKVFESRVESTAPVLNTDRMQSVQKTKTEDGVDFYTITSIAGSTKEFSVANPESKKLLPIPMGVVNISVGTVGRMEIMSTALTDTNVMLWSVVEGELHVTNGSVTAYGAGQGIVVASTDSYLFVAEVTAEATATPEFTISEQRVYLNPGETLALQALKNNEAYSLVSWTSADAGIVTVDGQGVLTANASGKTLVSAEIHGTRLDCEVIVRGVDGDLSEWIENGEPLYKGITMLDAVAFDKKAVIYARADEDGLWVGGYAYHELCTKTEDLWWQNTNFELILPQNGGQIQYYCSEGFRSAGATTFLTTVANPNATSKRDAFYSCFELHVAARYTNELKQYFRAGFAWKTIGDMMNIYYGGNLVQTEWWHLDGHAPKTDSEMYYIYADGIYETEKGE